MESAGRIEVFNPAAERLFGYTAGEMVGQSVNRLMPAPDCDEHDRYMARYLTTGVRKIIGIGQQVTGRRCNGKTIPWPDISPALLREALSTLPPVCWDCHIAETFRRLHRELVTDRPWPR